MGATTALDLQVPDDGKNDIPGASVNGNAITLGRGTYEVTVKAKCTNTTADAANAGRIYAETIFGSIADDNSLERDEGNSNSTFLRVPTGGASAIGGTAPAITVSSTATINVPEEDKFGVFVHAYPSDLANKQRSVSIGAATVKIYRVPGLTADPTFVRYSIPITTDLIAATEGEWSDVPLTDAPAFEQHNDGLLSVESNVISCAAGTWGFKTVIPLQAADEGSNQRSTYQVRVVDTEGNVVSAPSGTQYSHALGGILPILSLTNTVAINENLDLKVRVTANSTQGLNPMAIDSIAVGEVQILRYAVADSGAPAAADIHVVSGEVVDTTLTLTMSDASTVEITGLPSGGGGGGTPTPSVYQTFAAVRTEAEGGAFTAADFEDSDATSSMTSHITTPTFAANSYLCYARSAAAPDPTVWQSVGSSINQVSTLHKQAGTIAIAGKNYHMFRYGSAADTPVLVFPVLSGLVFTLR